MSKKYLFITQSDLFMQDSNGRTLRDVFGYVEDKNIYSFCTQRKNSSLSAKQTFCIDESKLFSKKAIHREAKKSDNSSYDIKNSRMKNPLTCILRNLAWGISFIFWRAKLKAWIKDVNPDVIVFNPGDFAFMHKIAVFVSKTAKKSIVIYNTEDYFFKTWNYLGDEKGFKWIYPFFRKQLIGAYNLSFSSSAIIIHNTPNLMEEYLSVFKTVKNIVVYHPSRLIANSNDDNFTKIEFYYCGLLDKGRDKTLLMFANILSRFVPEAKIIVNGVAAKCIVNDINNYVNIQYEGVVSYEKVKDNLLKKRVLLSINSLDLEQLEDKKHAFSTKLSDYIASFNIIFHISLPNDEYDTIKKEKLGFVASNEDEIKDNLAALIHCLQNGKNPFMSNMVRFYQQHLEPHAVYELVKKEVE